MEVNVLQISSFLEYFKGSSRGYGVHVYNGDTNGLKQTGKNRFVDGLVTDNLYKDHLNGKQGLGIVPVTTEGLCKFTVIDVDVYGRSLDFIVHAIERNGFPVVPIQSKSGGLHLYIFFKEFSDAKQAIELTKRMASVLNIHNFIKKSSEQVHALEIFPKQAVKQGNGHWINMPYFGANDKPVQVVCRVNKKLSLDEALALIQERATTLKDLELVLNNLPFNDAPPCLQTIQLLDAVHQNGGRNNYLFSWGAYFKKKNEDTFESELFQINDHMSDPLDSEELDAIIGSVRKKDYNYMCKQPPCMEYCNKTECKLREFGVGKVDGYFSGLDFGLLTQFKQDTPYYEWEIRKQGDENFKLLRFKDEQEIIKQDMFSQLCLRELYVLPMKLKPQEWYRLVSKSLEEIRVVNIEEQYDTSPIILLKSFIFDFFKGRSTARTKEEILQKRVYYSEDANEYWFRTADLLDYLIVNKNFRQYQPSEVHAKLRDFGCIGKQVRTEKRKAIRVYCMPEQDFIRHIASVIDSADGDKVVEIIGEKYDKIDETLAMGTVENPPEEADSKEEVPTQESRQATEYEEVEERALEVDVEPEDDYLPDFTTKDDLSLTEEY